MARPNKNKSKTPRSLELFLTPGQAADSAEVRRIVLQRLGRPDRPELVVVVRQRSIDARKAEPKVRLMVEVHDRPPQVAPPLMDKVPAQLKGRVVIVGAGPAGYFAALELLMLGLKPIVLERGLDVRQRRYDLRAIMQESRVGINSNYCFGEGGAGTYSDGKLYTRSDKRGDVEGMLRLLVEHGARSEILVDSHPHIGSNRLPGVVENIRRSILEHGGEVHFGQRVIDFILADGRIRGVRSENQEWLGDAVILATGHSARDIFELLHRHGLALEPKAYAVGVRVEHPQALIDEAQYRQAPRDPNLPPSSYRLVTQTSSCGVWSFCMCPGGLIVPAATAPGEIVVNGMSMSGRNSRWANSGIVAEVKAEDLEPYAHSGALAGLEFQRAAERRAFAASGDESQRAPAQRLVDFLADRESSDLPRSSYVPGLTSARLQPLLGARIYQALVEGFHDFGRKLKGFISEEAVVVGVESRTSSPVRIPRGENLQHPQVAGLYPCAEGAGYAGGIVSAALDGQRVARAVAAAIA